VNWAAIPDPKLEAELFRFKAGSFTDANGATSGLFEAASGACWSWMRSTYSPLGLQGKLIERLVKESRLLQTAAVIGLRVPFALLQVVEELPEEVEHPLSLWR
jgi:transcriptional regulator of acetoin/glycerol metabolism